MFEVHSNQVSSSRNPIASTRWCDVADLIASAYLERWRSKKYPALDANLTVEVREAGRVVATFRVAEELVWKVVKTGA